MWGYARARHDQVEPLIDASRSQARLDADAFELSRGSDKRLAVRAVVDGDALDLVHEPCGEIPSCGHAAAGEAKHADVSKPRTHQRLADSTKYRAKPAPAMMPVTIQKRSMICVSDQPFIS